ncbi:M20/M25/M40 family metallo-hydrolase [Hyphomonas sp. WL0036]|uniref:M20/M25/M40 family metallo-hydrolase n=1 Tax=Hyphomonas sediminis TaxID=2866160 RepID=UPI001C7F9F11|nr:M20/M25/M40 family metallo-hydrolase [Hyphomonas sediminis]MBY9068415.1 M20/M25/M40 family metallo-hydrolase [Hyphomonas sediminis]
MRIKSCLLASAAALFIAPFASAQERTPFELQAREIYQTAVEIRTAKGQGKIPELVDYLVSELKSAGFADILVTDHEIDGEKVQGLMVWYRAEVASSKKPIVLLAHMDVVDALPDTWTRYPFELIEEDGYFFGRGTADNKYGVTSLVATFLRLKAEGFKPNRDLVLVLSGDEETGMITTRAQAQFVAANIDPAYVLNADAGGLSLDMDGTPLFYTVQGAEKTYATFELTVSNPGGHSSAPRADNAIYELADALKKIEAYKFPVMSSPLTRASLKAAGEQTPGELGKAMLAFAANPDDAAAVATLRADPSTVGTTGTTCIATMLRGGHAENALPQRATATVNCRIFPGVGIEATEQALKDVIGNDGVKFKLISDLVESPESSLPEDVMAALGKALAARGQEGLPVFPSMSSGGTDGMFYRNLGYDTLGIGGGGAKPNDTFAHGLNERVLVDSFYGGLDHWYIILKELASED